MNIIIGILILIAGVILVIKSDWFLNNFGRMAWAEKFFGTSGGTRLGYKLLGILFIIIGVIFVTGSGNSFMSWLVSPLVR
jgi:1,4-dihydroxy-2-naphthoate octaprenyltransferase